jgi:hypothetical protein
MGVSMALTTASRMSYRHHPVALPRAAGTVPFFVHVAKGICLYDPISRYQYKEYMLLSLP